MRGTSSAKYFCTPYPRNSDAIETMAVVARLLRTYRNDILQTADFRCVSCGAVAQTMYNMPIGYLATDEPVVFDQARPFCRSAHSELRAIDQIKEIAQDIGKGSDLAVDTATLGLPNTMVPQIRDNALATTRVICGDAQNLKKCKGCRLVPYCSTYCQSLQWPGHKIWCKAHRSQCL